VPSTLTWRCDAESHLDTNWSDGLNWSAFRPPADGDDLVFPDGSLVSAPNNDMVNLRLNSLTFSGLGAGRNYGIDGNSFSLDSAIIVTANLIPSIKTDLVLTGGSPKLLITDAGADLFLNAARGAISGSGGITKMGDGSVELDGANSYTGRTTVAQGILIAGNASALGAVGADNDTVVSAGAQLVANFSGTAMETLSLSGAHASDQGALDGVQGTWGGPITLAANAAISVPAATFPISGRITGAGAGIGLTKLGPGALDLDGDNTYDGPTTVNWGLLLVNGQQPASPVTVNRVLGGKGTVGPITVNPGAGLEPGFNAQLSSNGQVSFADGTTYVADVMNTAVGPVGGALMASGPLTLGQTQLDVIVPLSADQWPPVGVEFPILSAASISGTFDGVPPGAIVRAAGPADAIFFRVSYQPTGVSLTRVGWATVTPMATARLLPAAATGPDGRIYVFSGFDAQSNPIGSVEAYDTSTGTWFPKTPLRTPRSAAVAAVSQGLIYVIGGGDHSNRIVFDIVEAYDPLTDTWTPKAPMHSARWEAAAATAPDGRIYVFGGQHVFNTDVVDTVECYDPTTDMWTTVAPLPIPDLEEAAVTGPDGRIYVIGGGNLSVDTLDTVQIYDPSTNTWSMGHPMPNPRRLLAATLGPDGRIYVIGGARNRSNLATAERYDPITDSWSEVASMNNARQGPAAATGPDGRIYAIGGFNERDHYLNTVEAFTTSDGGGGGGAGCAGGASGPSGPQGNGPQPGAMLPDTTPALGRSISEEAPRPGITANDHGDAFWQAWARRQRGKPAHRGLDTFFQLWAEDGPSQPGTR
jgi:autotransporter-associated beta strand protein